MKLQNCLMQYLSVLQNQFSNKEIFLSQKLVSPEKMKKNSCKAKTEILIFCSFAVKKMSPLLVFTEILFCQPKPLSKTCQPNFVSWKKFANYCQSLMNKGLCLPPYGTLKSAMYFGNSRAILPTTTPK
ncbi:MAG TPA: hypothetical protein VIJ75_10910 [Hanamia sp.]